jgi:hypothetical protein
MSKLRPSLDVEKLTKPVLYDFLLKGIGTNVPNKRDKKEELVKAIKKALFHDKTIKEIEKAVMEKTMKSSPKKPSPKKKTSPKKSSCIPSDYIKLSDIKLFIDLIDTYTDWEMKSILKDAYLHRDQLDAFLVNLNKKRAFTDNMLIGMQTKGTIPTAVPAPIPIPVVKPSKTLAPTSTKQRSSKNTMTASMKAKWGISKFPQLTVEYEGMVFERYFSNKDVYNDIKTKTNLEVYSKSIDNVWLDLAFRLQGKNILVRFQNTDKTILKEAVKHRKKLASQDNLYLPGMETTTGGGGKDSPPYEDVDDEDDVDKLAKKMQKQGLVGPPPAYMINYYFILGVDRTASYEEITKAGIREIKKLKMGSVAYNTIQQGLNILLDPQRRKIYDKIDYYTDPK